MKLNQVAHAFAISEKEFRIGNYEARDLPRLQVRSHYFLGVDNIILDQCADLDRTSLQDSVRFFRTKFLEPLQRASKVIKEQWSLVLVMQLGIITMLRLALPIIHHSV